MVIQVVHVVCDLAHRLTINVSRALHLRHPHALFAHLKKLPSITLTSTRPCGDDAPQPGHRRVTRPLQQLTTFTFNLLVVIGHRVPCFQWTPRGTLFLIPTPFVMTAAFFYYRYMKPISAVQVARWRLTPCSTRSSRACGLSRPLPKRIRRVAQSPAQMISCAPAPGRSGLVQVLPDISVASRGRLIIRYAVVAVLETAITLGTLRAFIGYLGMFYGTALQLTTSSRR